MVSPDVLVVLLPGSTEAAVLCGGLGVVVVTVVTTAAVGVTVELHKLTEISFAYQTSPLSGLMEHEEGPLQIELGGQEQIANSGSPTLASLHSTPSLQIPACLRPETFKSVGKMSSFIVT